MKFSTISSKIGDSLSRFSGIGKKQKEIPHWAKPYMNRAISPVRDDEIPGIMKMAVNEKINKVHKYLPQAKLHLATLKMKNTRQIAHSADAQAAYDDFNSNPSRDIIISNEIKYGRLIDGKYVFINWPSPATGEYHNLKITVPSQFRGGKSKRVKRTKTCKSKRSKRSKTCKNRVHKRRN